VSDAPKLRKTYLGDGVYIDSDGNGFLLTTEDGIRATNTIYLELEVMMALREYAILAGLTEIGGQK
jgi:hypothetical protein